MKDIIGIPIIIIFFFLLVKGILFFWKTVFRFGRDVAKGEFSKGDDFKGTGKELGDMAKSAIKHSFLFFM